MGKQARIDDHVRKHLKLLGARIGYLRRCRSLNQEQLAERAGISLSYLAKIEANTGEKIAMPSFATLYHIAAALEVPMKRLFEEEEL